MWVNECPISESVSFICSMGDMYKIKANPRTFLKAYKVEYAYIRRIG